MQLLIDLLSVVALASSRTPVGTGHLVQGGPLPSNGPPTVATTVRRGLILGPKMPKMPQMPQAPRPSSPELQWSMHLSAQVIRGDSNSPLPSSHPFLLHFAPSCSILPSPTINKTQPATRSRPMPADGMPADASMCLVGCPWPDGPPFPIASPLRPLAPPSPPR